MSTSDRIPFSKSCANGSELEYLAEVVRSGQLAGDGEFTRKAVTELERICGEKRILLTSSCSHSLDMAATLIDVGPGDEVIMPSYTFVSTANAFVGRGATPVFVDIEPNTMNVDPGCIESAITERTRAIVVVHYAGVAADMDEIGRIAKKHHLPIIEDAAQAINSYHRQTHLGTLGDIGTFSFHSTKNVTSGGEGGAIVINDDQYWDKARIIREKGTNRSEFWEGRVDKYTWIDWGSSYLMAEINAAFLAGQLEYIQQITQHRLKVWDLYADRLSKLADSEQIELPVLPSFAKHNAHIFWIKTKNRIVRSELMNVLQLNGISAPFHYVPLHSSPAGRRFGRFAGDDNWTSIEADRLLRLPLHQDVTETIAEHVADSVIEFLSK